MNFPIATYITRVHHIHTAFVCLFIGATLTPLHTCTPYFVPLSPARRPRNTRSHHTQVGWRGIATSRRSGFGVRDSGFGIRDSEFGVRGSGFGIRGSGFGVRGSGFGIRGSGWSGQDSLVSEVEGS